MSMQKLPAIIEHPPPLRAPLGPPILEPPLLPLELKGVPAASPRLAVSGPPRAGGAGGGQGMGGWPVGRGQGGQVMVPGSIL